jgi:hypothetical protein
MNENRFLMDYLVIDPAYNFGKLDADVMFATNDKAEAIEAAKFSAGIWSRTNIICATASR